MTLRAILPRLLLSLAIAGAAVWLGLNRDQLDPALIEFNPRSWFMGAAGSRCAFCHWDGLVRARRDLWPSVFR